ncbi:unnamed protein product [Litomosoides sigmodontis]|uniref:Uncharacterized protein n=1 Tax=Litomosoides sigmodontis TaxID=42156 RepID=A0A3P6SP23_LITSI|nr:unnamed protein product [Litomosoides sigmodontis]
MSGVSLQSGGFWSSLFHQTDDRGFQLGHFDRFVNGYGEIVCPESDLRYIFGPESIDLGPCCDPCDENWIKILKNGEFMCFTSDTCILIYINAYSRNTQCKSFREKSRYVDYVSSLTIVFSQGYAFPHGDGLVRTAKQVIIPETQNDHSFLGVVLRERHPSSTEGATAAFLCPPFGIIKLHKFAFGCDPDILWPPAVGARFWVTLDDVNQFLDESSTRVWKVDGTADDVEFGIGSTPIDIPKLYLWQWNKTFNRSGIFAIGNFISKTAETVIPTEEINRNCQGSSNMSTSMGSQNYDRNEIGKSTNAQSNSAAITLLLEILNDENIRDLVIERHQQAFENYIFEISDL